MFHIHLTSFKAAPINVKCESNIYVFANVFGPLYLLGYRYWLQFLAECRPEAKLKHDQLPVDKIEKLAQTEHLLWVLVHLAVPSIPLCEYLWKCHKYSCGNSKLLVNRLEVLFNGPILSFFSTGCCKMCCVLQLHTVAVKSFVTVLLAGVPARSLEPSYTKRQSQGRPPGKSGAIVGGGVGEGGGGGLSNWSWEKGKVWLERDLAVLKHLLLYAKGPRLCAQFLLVELQKISIFNLGNYRQ